MTTSTHLAATGLAHAARATPELASNAVERALERLSGRAGQVLLFLSAHYAADPRPAVVAAARAAQTTAVAGCTALGVLSDEEWVLDAPAACALVVADVGLHQPSGAHVVLAAPNAMAPALREDALGLYGGVAGDATGRGPFKVWQHGQLAPGGYVELPMPPAATLVSRGLAMIGTIHTITAVQGLDVVTLDGRQAATTLRRSLEDLPGAHDLALAVLGAEDCLIECLPVVSVNADGSVTVAGRLRPDVRVCWLRRSTEVALAEMRAITALAAPAYALVFSCGGRGPEFHRGVDEEWRMLREHWPRTPFAGFYGNGQVIHHAGANRLLHQSVVVAAFGSIN